MTAQAKRSVARRRSAKVKPSAPRNRPIRSPPCSTYYPDWLAADAALDLMGALIAEVAWQQDTMTTPGGRKPLPHLTA